MNKLLIILLITLTITGMRVNPANAENRSGNTLYETLHIKQMARQNFTNAGRTKYVYLEQEQDLIPEKSRKIGAVQLEETSKAKNVYIAVDMKRNNIVQRTGKRIISIAPISGAGRHLQKIHVLVNSNGKLHY